MSSKDELSAILLAYAKNPKPSTPPQKTDSWMETLLQKQQSTNSKLSDLVNIQQKTIRNLFATLHEKDLPNDLSTQSYADLTKRLHQDETEYAIWNGPSKKDVIGVMQNGIPTHALILEDSLNDRINRVLDLSEREQVYSNEFRQQAIYLQAKESWQRKTIGHATEEEKDDMASGITRNKKVLDYIGENRKTTMVEKDTAVRQLVNDLDGRFRQSSARYSATDESWRGDLKEATKLPPPKPLSQAMIDEGSRPYDYDDDDWRNKRDERIWVADWNHSGWLWVGEDSLEE